MENERIYRDLVTKQDNRKPLQYGEMLFAFQTVFHFTSYSYQCCPCAFQHEFFDYIDNDGFLNEEVFEKIAQSICRGKCPHVSEKVSEKLLKETVVSGLNIAIATGTDTPESMINSYAETRGCFKLQNYALALIKCNSSSAEYFYDKYLQTMPDPQHGFVLYCTKQDNAESFIINKLSDLEPFVHSGDEQLLKNIYRLRNKFQSSKNQRQLKCSTANAMEYAIQSHKADQLDTLLTQYNDQAWNSLGKFILLAIVYDNSEAIEKLLKFIEPDHQAKLECSLVMQMFARPNCKAILSNYGLLTEDNFGNDTAKVKTLLLKFIVYDGIRSECFTALQKLLDAESSNVYKCPSFPDISYQWHYHPQDIREMLKLHIHANIDSEPCGYDSVSFELCNDYNWEYTYNTEEGNYFQKPRSQYLYKCDGKEHGLLEHDNGNFALNFHAPFLLECGFKISREEIQKYLQETMHPAEKHYLQNYIQENFDSPTPLKMMCRRILRRHFKGYNINKYVEISDCPRRIKDFILMRDLQEPGNSTLAFQNIARPCSSQ